ncbi:MAG: cytochrome C [Bacteroidetes bacterium HGW-Bacteroidetes-1]|jgi:nitrate/TMAO reductase-like tetraheme cytochrome c subunit|nr:MAG: cytochrome C [Bacteroidetes bacterium HGW-Bacteroidetes-1]
MLALQKKCNHKKTSLLALFLTFLMAIFSSQTTGQISPGDLAEPHAHLEGISNCTLCHTLGDKVSDEKCLDCHKELKSRIDLKKGYHVSSEVIGKSCVSCHNDHHGRKFQIVRFDQQTFDHLLTGYKLEGAHNELECQDCHQKKFITDKLILEKKYTFLGLKTDCLSCHEDYHQKSLSNNCLDCHDNNEFKPANKFNHDRAEFKLLGKHKQVDCMECHKMEVRNGKDFQVFNNLKFSNCSSCHTDVHQNKFGPDCRSCHSEESFKTIKGISNFDHSKTGYLLQGRHVSVSCKDCHKNNYTEPLRHQRCTDCHEDYHKGQFVKPGIVTDCSDCHNLNGFLGSSFTFEKHEAVFPLKGAHQATPCFECHKKTEKWNFRNIGTLCKDCHEDIHFSYISEKYYPEANCLSCHDESTWAEVIFDHQLTNFRLEGKHDGPSCRACHFKEDNNGVVRQQFTGLTERCTNCHMDNHQQQFDEGGLTDCRKCHDFNDWKAKEFDHNKTRFPLDGKHAQVACSDCHKAITQNNTQFVLYKLNNIRCESCH